MEYDLIIVGMGIAGVSAAIYAKNSGLRVLMLEKDAPGGILNKINAITNYPGYASVSGPDLSYQLFESIVKNNISYKIATVTSIKDLETKKKVDTSVGEFLSKFVVIATGRKSRKLGLEHEKELIGKGISTCALCDGALYKDKDIAVVGGGNSALEEALYLSNIVKKVYLIHRRDAFRAEDTLIEKVRKKQNIEILWNSQITALKKDKDILEKIVVNQTKEIPVSALFTFIGFEPGSDFLSNLDIFDRDGYILVDSNYETSVKNIYAIGDCIKKEVYQLVTAANDGVMAAIQIIHKVKGN